ncbi:hypothetical protein [Mesorhizobium sp. M0586]|uniref:hypothetical protein n=1 Tax=unclassified Mesorhizobium TaxID=325217 RepID=UPI00333AFFBD
MDTVFWNNAITMGVALLGAGLGIMNTWQAISAGRVRLRVKPAYAIGVPAGEMMFSIEVVNLSNFAVTVTEVGFTLDGNTIKSRTRAAVALPILIDRKPWPRRLEARESVSAYFDPREMAGGRKLGQAYARTACGEVRYGSSPAAKQLRDIAT